MTTLPPPPTKVGSRGRAKMPDGTVLGFTVDGEIRRPQRGLTTKVIYLQRLTFDDDRTELRLCYYIIGKKPGARGRWVFGQFATMIPASDLSALVKEANARGWISL